MKEIEKKIIDFAQRKELFPAGSRVLCALSGGADSVCMTQILSEYRAVFGISFLAAAHFDHGIRGEESLRDASFVQDWCGQRSIPCVVGQGDVPAYAASHHLGLEEAGRELRYSFLERTADALSCSVIAVAHNMEDNAETILLHLARGTGSLGLGGIAPVRGRIVRPLLAVTRREIEAYLSARNLRHVEDSTNTEDAYSRNFLRHKVMPVMEEINPAFSAACLRLSGLMRQDEECLSSLAEEFIRSHSDGASLPTDALLSLPRAVSSRVVRAVASGALSEEHVSAVLTIASQPQRKEICLPGGKLISEQGRLFFHPQEAVDLPEAELIPGSTVELPDVGLRIITEISVYSGKVHDLFKPFSLKCDEIYGRLIISSRREGDRLRLRGRGCSKSLKKLYAEAGLTQRERKLLPVIRDEKGPLAAYGLAADERGTPRPGDRVFEITIVPINSKG